MLIYITAALLSGVSIVISRIINSQLGNKIGVFQSTFYNYITGLFLSGVFLLLSKETFFTSIDTLNTIPLVAYLGGLVGVISITFSNYVAPKISAFYMALLIFIGQLFVGILIDYFTLNQLSIGKIIGGIIVCIGLAYNLYIDNSCEPTKGEPAEV